MSLFLLFENDKQALSMLLKSATRAYVTQKINSPGECTDQIKMVQFFFVPRLSHSLSILFYSVYPFAHHKYGTVNVHK